MGIERSRSYKVSSDKSDTDSIPEINRITWKDPQKLYYSRASPPDILSEEMFSKIQNKYSSDAIYEWNIDGVSEQNLINILTQMVMLASTYKTIPLKSRLQEF